MYLVKLAGADDNREEFNRQLFDIVYVEFAAHI